MSKFKLTRTKQCGNCPWKVTTDPHDIPNGYSHELHKQLDSTIAKPNEFNLGSTLNVMACHHSSEGNEQHCVGWLHNQLGVGNNIGLRFKMMNCENIRDIVISGEQHFTLEDTLPTE